jgi:hypothetical protein
MTILDDVWRRTDRSGECWLWRGPLDRDGYGRAKIHGRMQRVGRFVWTTVNSRDPGALLVLHTCDVRACIRPSHLYLGTPHDNNQDCLRRKRTPTGSYHPAARLTDASVAEIREVYARGGVSQQALADAHGVSQHVVSKIVNFKRWRHGSTPGAGTRI